MLGPLVPVQVVVIHRLLGCVMLGRDLLGGRIAWTGMVLLAGDVRRPLDRVSPEPPAALGMAVVLAVDRDPGAEQRDVGQRSADDVVAIRVVPSPTDGVPDRIEN